MKRSVLILSVCTAIAGIATVTSVIWGRNENLAEPQMNEEQRATREKFFGSPTDRAPIEKGQEMRPRW